VSEVVTASINDVELEMAKTNRIDTYVAGEIYQKLGNLVVDKMMS
jgi:hypothetical protein